jgi:Protein of unknown function (DUF2971)
MRPYTDLERLRSDEDSIFHYTKLPAALEGILPSAKLRTSILAETDDPLEYRFKAFSMFGVGETKDAEKLYGEAVRKLDTMVRKECRLLSFCSNHQPQLTIGRTVPSPDPVMATPGWAKPRMWSQYAQGHRGMCIVLSRTELVRAAEKAAAMGNWFCSDHIQYTDSDHLPYPTMNINGNALQSDGLDKYCRSHLELHGKNLYFIKHLDYRDESEFRIVIHDPDGRAQFIDIRSAIRAVLAADRTNPVYFPIIESFAAKLKVGARQAYWQEIRAIPIGLVQAEET